MLRRRWGHIHRDMYTEEFSTAQGSWVLTRYPANWRKGSRARRTRPAKIVGAVLEEAGTSFDKVLKTTCFLADMGDFAAFNEVYAKYFTSKPARSCVAVKELPKGVLCEIEAIALK